MDSPAFSTKMVRFFTIPFYVARLIVLNYNLKIDSSKGSQYSSRRVNKKKIKLKKQKHEILLLNYLRHQEEKILVEKA